MSKLNKIGLLGGTFDPIHLGHLKIAGFALKKLKLKKIYFIPTYKHALKANEKISSPEIRLDLLKIALAEYPDFDISDIEIRNKRISYTINTVRNFFDYEKLDNAELYYLIGFDILKELHLWRDFEKIFDHAKLVVLSRTGKFETKFVDAYKNKIIFLNSPKIDISSTRIRTCILNKKSWKSMVNPKVFEYITSRNLYK